MKLGILMLPINAINFPKDTSLALLLEAQTRNYQIIYFEPKDIFVTNGEACASGKTLKVANNSQSWFEFGASQNISLADLDIILIRTDPPFDSHYLYLTHILELAASQGVLIVNNPQAIRDYNEKLAINWFKQFTPPSLVSLNIAQIKDFLQQHQIIIVKPLDSMGGTGIFLLEFGDKNTNVILETSTNNQQNLIMAQLYIPEIVDGDKRILIIDGVPIDYALARIPAPDEFRGNLAKGAKAVAVPLTEQQRQICQQLTPTLQAKGLMFVGLDMIGNYITEINVTSPTCVRELDNQFNLNISGVLFDAIEARL